MPSKDPIEVVMQTHFQKVNERCDRLEKLILKQITEQRSHQNNKRSDLGMRSRTLSALTLAEDSHSDTQDQGYPNELYREASPDESEV